MLNYLNKKVEDILKKSKKKIFYLIKKSNSLSRWSTMSNPKDYYSMSITTSAIDILLELQTIFSNLSINLLKNVFNEIRARIIMEYDEFLFNCVCD